MKTKIYIYTHENYEVIQDIEKATNQNQLKTFATIWNILLGQITIWDFSRWLSSYLNLDYIVVKEAIEKFLDDNSL